MDHYPSSFSWRRLYHGSHLSPTTEEAASSILVLDSQQRLASHHTCSIPFLPTRLGFHCNDSFAFFSVVVVAECVP